MVLGWMDHGWEEGEGQELKPHLAILSRGPRVPGYATEYSLLPACFNKTCAKLIGRLMTVGTKIGNFQPIFLHRLRDKVGLFYAPLSQVRKPDGSTLLSKPIPVYR